MGDTGQVREGESGIRTGRDAGISGRRGAGGGREGAKRIQMVAGAREPGGGRRAMPHTPTSQAAKTAGPRCSNHPR